jgi:hypothetical protein
MTAHERSVGAAAMALLALAGLAGAWTWTWFEVDFSSGRQTPPDGAYNGGEDGIVRHHLAYRAGGWTGDLAPDAELARRLAAFLPPCIAVAAGALALVALGEIPLVHRVIRRRVALALVAVALAAIAAAAAMAWAWMPESMAAHRVDSQFAARLDEPSGYTSSHLSWGWYAVAASIVPAFGAGLFKFQAGQVSIESVAALLHPRRPA